MRRVIAILVLALIVQPAVSMVGGAADAPIESRALNCAGTPSDGAPTIPALENQLDEGLVCWGHIGTHTYFVGVDGPLALRGGAGVVVPAETGAVGQGAFVQAAPILEPGVVVETSLDGVTWSTVTFVDIPNRPAIILANLERITGAELPAPPVSALHQLKPRVEFTLPDTGEPFRFLRIRQPMSPTGGLSGYLDHSELVLDVAAAPPAPAAARAGHAERDCGAHLLDAVFPDRPCAFGSTASYFDAPSFTHTYWLGGVDHVARASGSATLHPYRSLATVQQQSASVTVILESSLNGTNDWERVGEFEATWGVPAAFEFAGLDVDARLVRLRAEPHRLFASPGTHHWAGFLVQSTLVLEGDVAASAPGGGAWSDYAWAMHDAARAPT